LLFVCIPTFFAPLLPSDHSAPVLFPPHVRSFAPVDGFILISPPIFRDRFLVELLVSTLGHHASIHRGVLEPLALRFAGLEIVVGIAFVEVVVYPCIGGRILDGQRLFSAASAFPVAFSEFFPRQRI